MKTIDLAEEIWLGVSANKVRSGLTMLGIVIGIASVIAMLSVGQGAKAQIESNIQSLGSNLLIVMPGAQRGAGGFVSAGRGSSQTLTREDADALAGVSGVAAVAPEATGRYQVTVGSANTNTQVLGTTGAYPAVRNLSVAEGAFFTDSQVMSRAKVAVIGPTTRDDLFGEGGAAIGQRVRINGQQFSVVGVTASKGGSGFTNQDDLVIVPISTMETFLSGNDSVGTISVQARDQSAMAATQEAITAELMNRHKVAAPDFSVLNQADIVSAASSITDTFTVLLAAIASISLLVGGIGIMNMMLTTVTERTREIGLRQAIGARKGEIVGQFLGEAVLLTALGGSVGILAGFGISRLVSTLMSMPTVVSAASVAMAFGVSAAIGLVFGYYPARRAARLDPIHALRYE